MIVGSVVLMSVSVTGESPSIIYVRYPLAGSSYSSRAITTDNQACSELDFDVVCPL
jgi:hypothetical protein